jgi:hypothetical protein
MKRRLRLGKIGTKKRTTIEFSEKAGVTRRNFLIAPLPSELAVSLPNSHYELFNMMASGTMVYRPWRSYIYWKDDGDAVKTFKKNGNWYLAGVGGGKHFQKEGLPWNLISTTLEMRYLLAGAVFDSGAPVAILRDGIDADELYFILGWLLTDHASKILRGVLNQTRNTQSKDIERMP